MKKFLIITILLSTLFLNAQEIKLGMSTDLSGPISTLGKSMKEGIESYLEKNNENKDKKYTFSLKVYDDQYNPIKASKNVERLIKKDNVLAFIGNLGTPTAKVTTPIANKANIVVFGSYTGTNLLRKTIADENVFNFRISYKQEVEFIISNLLKNGIKPNEIVFFSQNDAYGNTGYFSALEELKKRGYKNLNNLYHGRYNSHSLNVEAGLSKLLDYPTQPKVVLMFATTNPIIKFMKLAKSDFPNAKFISISPIARYKIIDKLKSLSEGLIITQTVPLLSSKMPIVQEFLFEYNNRFPYSEPNLSSLDGYIVGKLFVDSLNNSNKKVTDRQSIIKILSETKELDIGLGFNSGFDKKYNQYSSKIWTSIIRDSDLKEFRWDKKEVNNYDY